MKSAHRLCIFYYSRQMTIPVFISIDSTLTLPEISSKGISSVYDLLLPVWENQHLLLKDMKFSQLSLRGLICTGTPTQADFRLLTGDSGSGSHETNAQPFAKGDGQRP